MADPCLTIVIPTYRPHFGVAASLVESIERHITDPESALVRLVVEAENCDFVDEMRRRFGRLNIEWVTTEDILTEFNLSTNPGEFLSRVGKFSFQALKKIGGIMTIRTDWCLVLDSESLFLRPFSARKILDDYRKRKYVFYSKVSQRGASWAGSLSDVVTRNAARLVGGTPDRWFMEYYHWFYDRTVWTDLIARMRRRGTLYLWLENQLPMGIFENVLYYQYVANNSEYGYEQIDVVEALQERLPERISARIAPAMNGRLTVVGLVEHIVNLVCLEEFAHLSKFFSDFSLPFLRLELNVLNPAFVEAIGSLPSVVALVSSHRLEIASKRVAVCVAGEFRSVHDNIRSIRNFVTGVECDIYVHCWNDDKLPVIKDGLRPFAIAAEDRPDLAALEQAITRREPMSKPDRDTGSLYMFHGIQRSLEMMANNGDRYNIVVRVRPDMFFERSLREILGEIAEDQTGESDVVYLPNSFHSQGVNDQFAIGRTAPMLRYAKVFDFAAENIGVIYFNPEHVFASHLLEQKLCLRTLPMNYVLLRSEPADIGMMGHLQRVQRETWWSAFLPGPWRPRTANGMFRTKRAAMEYMYERGVWENWEFLVETSAFTSDSQRLFSTALVKVSVEHEYKDPNVTLRVDVIEGGLPHRRYVDVDAEGLRVAAERPAGLVFVRAGPTEEALRLTQFNDDLEKPAGDLTISTRDVAAAAPGSYMPAVSPAPARSPQDAHAFGRVGASSAVPPLETHTALLERFLFRAEPRGSVSTLRRIKARLLLKWARAHRRRGRILAARSVYGRVLQLNPFLGREWIQYGHALKDSGDWQAAVSAYAMALRLLPGDADATLRYQDALTHV